MDFLIRKLNFYFVGHNRDVLTFNIHVAEAFPILWNNKGIYCLIPKGKVQNMIDSVKDHSTLSQLERNEYGVFHWDDGILIDTDTAIIILASQ